MPQNKFSIMADRIKEFLGEQAQRSGKASGFVKRISKLDAAVFVQTLVLGLGEKPDASLSELVETSAELGVSISPQGLDGRLNEGAVALLRGLFQQALEIFQNKHSLTGQVLTQFSSIYLLDSTVITLPAGLQSLYAGCKTNGGAAALKVQLCFEYLRGNLRAVQVVAGRSPDQNCRLQLEVAEANSLHLFDLGYFKQEILAALDDAHAFFISRLQPQTALYELDGSLDKVDLGLVLAQQTGQCYEHSYLLGQHARLKVRLVAQRLPSQLAAQRRRKALAKFRKKGKCPSATYLQLLDWNLFVTNVPAQRLSPLQVCTFYRLRWHIELVFKLWKSLAHLDAIGAWRPERVLCVLYAKLIGLILFHWLLAPERFAHHRELSAPKAFRFWQAILPRFITAFAHAGRGLLSACAALLHDFRCKALKSSRRKSPSTYRLLLALPTPPSLA